MTSGFGLAAQVEYIDAEVESLHKRIAALATKRHRLETSWDRWATESDERMTKRLRFNRNRQGMREARYRVAGDRRKDAFQNLSLRAFTLIANECRKNHAGFQGVELSLAGMASKLKCSKRQLRRIVSALDTEHKLLVRIEEPGKPKRYAVSLPDNDRYQQTLLDTFQARVSRVQEAAAKEAAHDRLESVIEGFGPGRRAA